jgi:penicillin-binding protein 1A
MASAASSPLKRGFIIMFKIGLYTGIVGIIALVVAVGIAMSSLPSYQELVRRDDLGQMIRVVRPTAPCSSRWGRASESG